MTRATFATSRSSLAIFFGLRTADLEVEVEGEVVGMFSLRQFNWILEPAALVGAQIL